MLEMTKYLLLASSRIRQLRSRRADFVPYDVGQMTNGKRRFVEKGVQDDPFFLASSAK